MMAIFNKILNVSFFIVFGILSSQRCFTQEPNTVKELKIYCNTILNAPYKHMVEVKTAIPVVEYDLRYATINNFIGKKLYKKGNRTYLREPLIHALQQVVFELQQKNLTLKIFDAYRPYSITKYMWEIIHDDRYVADPSKGSGHNRGLAVDLTIIDMVTKKEIDMGTGFDNFTDSAHHSFFKLPEQTIKNRQYLKMIMEKYGFHALETEWWHYSFPNDMNYEVLDIDFRKLQKACD